MKAKLLVCAAALAAAAPTLAGTKPLYAPAPAWVTPAPAIDPATTAAPRLILDQQQRLDGGTVWSYVDTATRVTSQQSLLEAGTIILGWQPDEGDLIVHRLAIIRDGHEIDLIAGKEPLTILRRERGLESLELDGVLTATMPVPGLEVGDVLRVTYSTTVRDPALKGAMQSTATILPDQTEVGFARIRVLWPAGADVRWKALAKVRDAKVTKAGDLRELTVATPMPKQPDLPDDAPARFHPLPLVELSTFRDWPDVSRTMAPLFAPVELAAGSPLAAEAARIRAAASDPLDRAALALASVEGNVRYLFNGLDHGNYVPQPPDKTWAIRSGDCKAKTLLLLSLLHALDIAAEPVLANTRLGDFLPERLPSAGAFNHILVAATIGGRVYWLDGTGLGTRRADLGDTPNLRWVLPLRAGGSGLVAVATRPDARPALTLDVDTDESAGIGIAAPVTATTTLRGPAVEALKAAEKQLSGDKRKAMLDRVGGAAPLHMLVARRSVDFDSAAGTATVRLTGVQPNAWDREDQRYQDSLGGILDGLTFAGDRGRPEWHAIPVATPGVRSRVLHEHLRLPGDGRGFAVEGDRTLPPQLAGRDVTRSVTDRGGVIDVVERIDETATEVPADRVAATRAALELAKSRKLLVAAPRDYPRHWQVVRDARRAGRIAAVEAIFATALADATEKPPILTERASFRASVYDRAGAIADLDTVIAARPTVPVLLLRGELLRQSRKDAAALADTRAAYDLDPGSTDALGAYAEGLTRAGQSAAAVALLDEQIAAGGERKGRLLAIKADVLVKDHRTDDALAASDAAIAAKPGTASLLNSRCWVKATLGVQLDTALKDCTKALELGNAAAQTLDSRAMVYLKMGRLDDALADIDAALLERPDQTGSLFLRGAIEAKLGKRAAADDDLTGARAGNPRIDDEYRRYGVAAT